MNVHVSKLPYGPEISPKQRTRSVLRQIRIRYEQDVNKIYLILFDVLIRLLVVIFITVSLITLITRVKSFHYRTDESKY